VAPVPTNPAASLPAGLRLRRQLRLRARATRGDDAAFAVLFQRHHQELYRFCRSILRHEEDARDAVQSAMTKAFAALQTEERDFELRPWLFRIAHNEAISILRARRPAEDLDAVPDAGTDSLEQTVADRERLAQLRTDLLDLPARQRAALVLRELSGLSHEEIAEVLESTPRSVKQTIFEARTALHECAEGRAMACDAVQRALSDGDGRVLRGRRLRSHVSSCAACGAFAAQLHERPADLAALAPPLPLAAAAALAAKVLGGAKGAALGGAGAAGGAAAAGGALGAAGATSAGGAAAGGAAAAGGGAAAAGGTAAVGAGAVTAAGGGGLLAGAGAKVAIVAAVAAIAGGTTATQLPERSHDRPPVTRRGAPDPSSSSPAAASHQATAPGARPAAAAGHAHAAAGTPAQGTAHRATRRHRARGAGKQHTASKARHLPAAAGPGKTVPVGPSRTVPVGPSKPTSGRSGNAAPVRPSKTTPVRPAHTPAGSSQGKSTGPAAPANSGKPATPAAGAQRPSTPADNGSRGAGPNAKANPNAAQGKPAEVAPDLPAPAALKPPEANASTDKNRGPS
jgi:RNA polymerase sigma factor (sigma-70 family)